MATTNVEIQKLDTILTELIKKGIKKKGLVDTGSLLKSINVKTKIQHNKISFNIEAEDYYEYLDEEYKITEDVLKSPQWNKAIEDAMTNIIEIQLETI